MTITSNQFDKVTIHTYTAPENGALVNSHIIETNAHLILVDTQFLLPYAQEMKNFVSNLKKPIERIIISHGHPDHWFGTAAFEGEKVYAIQEVLDEIQETGPAAVERNKIVLDSLVPNQAVMPTFVLNEGEFTIDDVVIRVSKVADTESSFMTILELVEQGVVITQDVVYNGVHLFVAQQEFENWKSVLVQLGSRQWNLVLPGHGLPTTNEAFGQMVDYLSFAKETLSQVETFAQYKEAVIAKFPEHKGEVLIDLNEQFLGLN